MAHYNKIFLRYDVSQLEIALADYQRRYGHPPENIVCSPKNEAEIKGQMARLECHATLSTNRGACFDLWLECPRPKPIVVQERLI